MDRRPRGSSWSSNSHSRGDGHLDFTWFVISFDANNTLEGEYASREHGASFTRNYEVLFPGNRRYYRSDGFEGSIDQQDAMYINGDKFEISPKTILLARQSQEAWHDLGCLSSVQPGGSLITLRAKPAYPDCPWAKFEEAYTSELIKIEAESKNIISALSPE